MFDYNFFMFLEMCPPLISDSLNIKCTLNGNYANCSNLSIPETIAMQSCKESHTLPINEKEDTINLILSFSIKYLASINLS